MMGMGWRLVHAMTYTCGSHRTLLLNVYLIFYIYIDPNNQIESASRFVHKALYFQTSFVARYFLCLNIVLACFIVVAFFSLFLLQSIMVSLWKYMWKIYINPIHLYYVLLPSFSSNCSPIFQMVTLLFQFLN